MVSMALILIVFAYSKPTQNNDLEIARSSFRASSKPIGHNKMS